MTEGQQPARARVHSSGPEASGSSKNCEIKTAKSNSSLAARGKFRKDVYYSYCNLLSIVSIVRWPSARSACPVQAPPGEHVEKTFRTSFTPAPPAR